MRVLQITILAGVLIMCLACVSSHYGAYDMGGLLGFMSGALLAFGISDYFIMKEN